MPGNVSAKISGSGIATGTSSLVVDLNLGRQEITIVNDTDATSGTDIYLALQVLDDGPVASTRPTAVVGSGIRLVKGGGSYTSAGHKCFRGAIACITSGSSGNYTLVDV